MIEDFADLIAPPSVESKINYLTEEQESENHFLTLPLTYAEFVNATNSKSDSSPGLDNITYSMIKELPETIKIRLFELLNRFFVNNVIPKSWSTHKVIMVSKPNQDLTLALSYRSITLASCIGKVFEMIIKNRMEWYIESQVLLCHSQLGFRKGKSTLDNLTIL